MVNSFKMFLLQNQWGDCLKTCYEASGSLLLLDDPGFTLTSLKIASLKVEPGVFP